MYLEKLQQSWPTLNHWDNWMRANMDEFDCIVPSLPRNRNFGITGSSMNSAVFQRDISTVGFYEKKEMVDFGSVEYLLNSNYERLIRDLVRSAMPLDRIAARDPSAPKVCIPFFFFSVCKLSPVCVGCFVSLAVR